MKRVIAILLLAACMAHADDRKPAAKAAGKWEVSTENNPDNTQTTLLSLGSEAGESGPVLFVRKTGDVIQVFVSFPGPSFIPEEADSADVTLRWDSAKAVTQKWGIGKDGKSVFCHFLPQFFDGLMKCHKLTVTLNGPGQKPVTHKFDLDGFSVAVKSLGIIELPVEGSRTLPTAPSGEETITFPEPQQSGSWTGFGGTGTSSK